MRSVRSNLPPGAAAPSLRVNRPWRAARRARGGASPAGAAFSLIEVIAAVAIFTLGMVGVLGLFTPVTKSVANVSDAEAAARVADSVRARLEAMPFAKAAALIQTAAQVQAKDADPRYNLNDATKSSRVIFGELNGEVGIYDNAETRPNWRDSANRTVSTADRFFEIDLIRNDAISPVIEGAPPPAVIAYTMRVRWPAFVQTSANAAVQAGQTSGGAVAFDQSRKQMLFFTGAIRR